MLASTSSLIGNRYDLHEQLGRGGMGIVYRATDRLRSKTVALKQVVIQPDFFPASTVTPGESDSDLHIALAREFQMLASLRHPNIISVLDYGFDTQHQPFFTMRLLQHSKTILDAGENQSVEHKVHLIIQLFQALSYLHRRGIIHRDLKPANILTDSDNNIHVLDFGLAIDNQRATGVAGTIAYMAPELFSNQQSSVKSDLYAAGMIAYELFVGSHPFPYSNMQRMISAIMREMPNPTPLIEFPPVKDDGPHLASIIGRLLAKAPAQRYASAQDVIQDLSAFLGQALPSETIAVRESFLQAATFIGRETELEQLVNAMREAIDGNGGAWLIGGESGIGKSRLMEELRIRALVKGALVLEGQAVEGGGLPYQLWRDPLRLLILSTDISDLEASILKDIIPDISSLLERDISDPPKLSGNAHQQRLVATIAELFKRQTRPIVLLLEDLQWTKESLEPLRALNAVAEKLSLIIIGSYRDDERPNLPTELPSMNLITLDRLSKESLTALSASMLGEVENQADVIELINKETEGNIFFMVEVIRALADDAGSLANIGRMTLPQTVFAGGIQRIIQHRLSRVPIWAYNALQLAAIAGRNIDLTVLAKILADDQINDLQHLLMLAADAAILAVHGDHWYFAHDKLREQLIADTNPADRPQLHRRVAHAIESTYPDNDEYAAILTDHWRIAGDVGKEARYAFIAGKQAVKACNIPESIDYFLRALELTPEDDHTTRTAILTHLGNSYRINGEYENASQYFELAIYLATDIEARACAWIGLAWAQQTQGYDQESLTSAEHAEKLLWSADPPNHTLLAETMYHKGWALFRLNQAQAAKDTAEEGLALSSAVNAQQEKAHNLNLLSVIYAYMQGDYDSATLCQQQALAIHRDIGDRHGEGILLCNLGENARLQGDYTRAQDLYQQAINIARDIGDRDGEMAYLSNLSGAQIGLNNFDEPAAQLEKLIADAPQDWYVLPDAYCFLAEAYLGQNRSKNALKIIQTALQIPNAAPDSLGHAWRILGRIASVTNQPVSSKPDSDTTYFTPACFTQSLAIFDEAGMQRDRALTLWDWATHERSVGNLTQAESLWQNAYAIFEKLNLPLFIEKMNNEKQHS